MAQSGPTSDPGIKPGDDAAAAVLPPYFFPGTWVNGELPTATAGFGFSAFGLRISLLLRA